MRKWLLIFLLAVAVIFYIFYLHKVEEGVKAGEVAPLFSLKNRQGDVVSLDGYRGRAVLVHFWATWCPSCFGEMLSLERLKKRFRDEEFMILGVSVDEDGWGVVDRFIEKNPVTFPILLDEGGGVSYLYGTYRLPETYLIDTRGVVVKKFVGPHEWGGFEVEDMISSLVR